MFELIASMNDLSGVDKFQFSVKDYKTLLNWKNEREFEYNNKMYDVIKIESNSEIITIHCIWDEQEDELIANFEKHFHRNALKDKLQLVQNSLITAHFFAIKTNHIRSERTNTSKVLSENYFNYYHSRSKKTLTPPPKFI